MADMTNVLIGVDPGKSGGIAILDLNSMELDLLKTTDTLGVYDKLSQVQAGEVYFEKNTGIPMNPNTGVRQSVHSNYRFGLWTGITMGQILSSECDVKLIPPTRWQRAVGIELVKGETSTKKKNRHKDLAIECWPDQPNITHWQADALLILTYALMLKED